MKEMARKNSSYPEIMNKLLHDPKFESLQEERSYIEKEFPYNIHDPHTIDIFEGYDSYGFAMWKPVKSKNGSSAGFNSGCTVSDFPN